MGCKVGDVPRKGIRDLAKLLFSSVNDDAVASPASVVREEAGGPIGRRPRANKRATKAIRKAQVVKE